MKAKPQTHTALDITNDNSFANRNLQMNTKHAYKDGTMKHTSNTHRRVLGIIAAVCCVVAMPSMVSAAGKPSKGQVYACVNAQTGDILRILPDETGRCAKKEHLVMMYPTTNSGAATAGASTTTTVAGATPPNQIDLSLPPGVGPVRISGSGATTTTTTRPPAADGDLLTSIRADLNATTASSIILRITNKGPGRVDGPALAVIVVPQSVKTTNCTNSVWSSSNVDVYTPVAVSQQYGGPMASCKIPWTLNLASGESVDVPFNIATWGATAPASIIVGGGIFRAEATGATPVDADAANNVTTPVLADVDSNGIETFADVSVDRHIQLRVVRNLETRFGAYYSYNFYLTSVGTQALSGEFRFESSWTQPPLPASPSLVSSWKPWTTSANCPTFNTLRDPSLHIVEPGFTLFTNGRLRTSQIFARSYDTACFSVTVEQNVSFSQPARFVIPAKSGEVFLGFQVLQGGQIGTSPALTATVSVGNSTVQVLQSAPYNVASAEETSQS
jgi:hypothetical protein